MYEEKIAKNGKVMHFKDGKLISYDKYLEGISLQGVQETVVNQPPPVEESKVEASKDCIFCGSESKRRKFVNLKIVHLCEEDYLTKTTGEIAERIREIY